MANEFGARIRELRVRKGWKQDDVARRAGIAKSYLSGIESGYLVPPAPDKVMALLDALEIDAVHKRKVLIVLAYAEKAPQPVKDEFRKMAQAYLKAHES